MQQAICSPDKQGQGADQDLSPIERVQEFLFCMTPQQTRIPSLHLVCTFVGGHRLQQQFPYLFLANCQPIKCAVRDVQ